MFRLQLKSVSIYVLLNGAQMHQLNTRQNQHGPRRRLLCSWLRYAQNPNTLVKNSKPPQINWQRDLPLYICTYPHIYIKSLLCKIFQSWGLKRQHRSQLSAVPPVLCPVLLLVQMFLQWEQNLYTAVLLVPMCGRANSTKSSIRTGHAPDKQANKKWQWSHGWRYDTIKIPVLMRV